MGDYISQRRIVNFLEEWTTLHYTIEMLYVVDGYEVTIEHDGNMVYGPFKGETLRGAFIVAISATRHLGGPHARRAP